MRISDWSSDVCSSDLSLNSGVPGVGVLQETSNAAAGVQVTLPIFTGGRRSAQVRQAQSRSSQAIEQYIEVERGVIAQTRGAYAAWQEIGRASGRERVGPFVSISVVAVSLTKNKN